MASSYAAPRIVESRRLLPHHVQELGASTVDFETAALAGVCSIGHAAAYDFGIRSRTRLDGLCFRYWDPLEQCFSQRFVRLKPDLRSDGRKYLQPVGERPKLYFIAGTTRDDLQNVDKPILITEGEKKALALDKAARSLGVSAVVIGIGGVWGWRHSPKERQPDGSLDKGKSQPLPELDRLLWEERSVALFLDSDVLSNEKVAVAERALAQELVSRKARLQLARLPQVDSEKAGIDDILAREGASVLPRLLSQATPFPPPSELQPLQILAAAGLDSLASDSAPELIEAALRRLASSLNGADALRRGIVREAAVRRLQEIGISAPARLVDAALRRSRDDDSVADLQGHPVLLADPEPWPDPVDGVALLDELARTYATYLVLPKGAQEALALWSVHAHALEASFISPILVFTSPQKRCGKTTALELLANSVSRPLSASNITAASLFRAVEEWQPTLLIDEADTFLSDNEELRGVLNSGHSRSTALVVRTAGEGHEPRTFATWCPKAIALIGKLRSTLEDRAIVIGMRRRKRTERVERLRRDRIAKELEPLRRKAARWAQDHLEALKEADPAVPKELHDRAQDNWRPLLAIADQVGGSWSQRARESALELTGMVEEGESAPGIQLLSDLQELFRERAEDGKLSSQAIVDSLAVMEDRPWPEWRKGKPLTKRQMARLLRPFGVRPKQVWSEGKNQQGYQEKQLLDAFSRYLPPTDPLEPLERNGISELGPTSDPLGTAPSRVFGNDDMPCPERVLGDLGDRDPEGHADGPRTALRPAGGAGRRSGGSGMVARSYAVSAIRRRTRRWQPGSRPRSRLHDTPLQRPASLPRRQASPVARHPPARPTGQQGSPGRRSLSGRRRRRPGLEGPGPRGGRL